MTALCGPVAVVGVGGGVGLVGLAAVGAAAAAATLWAGISVLGAAMPREHIVTRTLRLRAGRHAAWGALADIGSEPEWFDGLEVQRLPDRGGRQVWRLRFVWTELETELVEVEHPRRIQWHIRDARGHFRAEWTFALEETGDGPLAPPDLALPCLLTATEKMEILRPAARFVVRRVIGEAHYLEKFLAALARRVDGPAAGPVQREHAAADAGARRPPRGPPPRFLTT